MNANGSSTSTSTGRPARLAIPARHAASASVDLPLVDSAVSATDPVLEELARLEELRQSVRQNLQLRPIGNAPIAGPTTGRARAGSNASSLASPSTPASVYYTPIDDYSPTPFSPKYATPVDQIDDDGHNPQGLHPRELFHSLELTDRRPLLLDTRPLPAYFQARIQGSINLSIPSLILKRVKKPGAGFKAIDALRPYITTESARATWDDLLGDGGAWDGNVVLFDDEMDEADMNTPAWTLFTVLQNVVPPPGAVSFLRGGFALVRSLPDLGHHIDTTEPPAPAEPPRIAVTDPGQPTSMRSAFTLRTDITAPRTRTTIDHSPTPSPGPSPRPPTPRTPGIGAPAAPLRLDIPPPPASPGPTPALQRPRPRVPSLKTLSLDTSLTRGDRLASAHPALPRLQTNTDSASTSAHPFAFSAVPPSGVRGKGERFPGAPPMLLAPPAPRDLPRLTANTGPPPPSPSHLIHAHSAIDTSSNARFDWSSSSSQDSSSSSPPSSPRSPHTARPLSTPDSSEMPAQFVISEILPHFLFLGPEITLPEHVEALEQHGIRRILNIAAECDDDHGLYLKERFDKYMHIPIRDTVEEENIAKGVQEVCKFLDDARLHSSATYVHCKAGKSRSVTAVMAYLIHANHWTLSRAYAFVLERRKGISPNIGFVSELMTFEERELGGKSVGVQQVPTAASAVAPRRPAHIRESLPPQNSDSRVPQYLAGLADAGEELEVRDPSGRYRHQRRAPVDERTLQPTRRVSKAGLESTDWRDGANSEGSGSDW